MSRLVEYNWLPAVSNTAAICATQTLAAAGNLALNGTFVSMQYPSVINVLAVGGTSRSISLTSTNNLSGVTFVVTGYQNGVAVTSGNIVGPNSTTVTVNTVVFDIVTSITANNAAANISVGIGTTGYFPLIQFNYGDSNHYREGCHMRGWALAYTSAISAITPTVYGTVADATISDLSYASMIARSQINTGLTTFFLLPEVAYISNTNSANFLATDNTRFFNQILVTVTGAPDTGIARIDFRDTW